MNAISGLRIASFGDMAVRRFPPLYHAFRRQISAFEDQDTAGRAHLQEALIDTVLAKASQLPGYAALKGRPYEAYPRLTKDMLRQAPEDFQSSSRFLTATAATSGSTGIPLAIKRSFASVVFEQAAIDHVVALAGADFRHDKIAVLRGEAIKAPSDKSPPFWRMERSGRVMNFSVAHLNVGTADTFFTALQAFAPKVIWAYPSALELLVSFAESRGWSVDVPVVLTSSEVLTDDVRARAAQRFGACVADYYGQAERVAFAYALAAKGYRFMPAYGRVELQPADETNAQAFRIIATNLRNKAQPLIRYEAGDIAVSEEALDQQRVREVALGTRPFARIEGRETDYLVAPDGSRLIGMNHIPRSLAGLVQMQLRQTEPDRVVVLAVTEQPDTSALGAAITAKLAARLPTSMRIEVRFCPEIAREKGGKMPLVVRAANLDAPL